MIPRLVREFATQLALRFAFRARRMRVSDDDVNELQAWAVARLAENDYELLRTTKLSDVWMLIDRLVVEYHALWVQHPNAGTDPIKRGLEVRVKCLDVEVGCATFERAFGLAYATLEPSTDYQMIAQYAREIGNWLAVRHYWDPMHGDATDFIGSQWRGERLSLENHHGQELAVSHVIITEAARAPHNKLGIQLVADFRPDHARVAAVVPTEDIGSGGRSRPR